MIGPDSGENTEELFHSAFMQSGAAIPVGHIRDGQVCTFVFAQKPLWIDAFPQKYYDFLVDETGCALETDTLNCLRGLDYPILKAAVDKSPNAFNYQVR